MRTFRWCILACIASITLCGSARAEEPAPTWTCTVPYQSALRPNPGTAHLWLPEGVPVIRGMFLPGAVRIEKAMATDPVVRAALAEMGMGVVWLDGYLGSIASGGGATIEQALRDLAEKSGHPEVARVPWLTAGHSAAGIFCRNVAYWKPHRVIAVIMIKSGNFHRQIDDMDRTLAGVPLILFSGEFEEYGPEGGDLGVGLRSEFSADPTDKAKLNQTQWLMARMQMLDRRRKNPDNLWTLVVHRGHGHTTWDDEMRDLAIQYMRGCVALRVPDTIPDGADEVRCRPVTARDGWLYDADIKTPRHAPAPHDAFAGDRTQAFWAPDRAIAESLAAYHGRGWETPDPTQHWPNERRFTPPDLLKDLVDAPPPVPLPWQGGDGTWAPDTKHWRDGEALMAWDPHRQAVLTTGRVALGADITCAGLRIGNGAMLDASGHQLRSRWHAAFAEDSQLRLTVSGGPDGRADGSLWIEGTTALGGTLLVEPVGPISSRSWPARRRIITCDGVMRGAFARTVLPEGWQLVWEPQKHGGTYGVLLIPKPADAAAR